MAGPMWKPVRVVLFGLAFLFVIANVHEIGHTVTARLLGDGSAHYLLYQVRGQSTCFGCNLYDSASLSDTGNILVNLGGVFFTQLLAWSAIFLLARRDRPRLEPWMALTAIALTWSGDLVLQLVQGLQAQIPDQLPRGPEVSYTDYLAVVWFMRDRTGTSAADLKQGLLWATIAYSGLLLFATSWALRRRRPRASSGQLPRP